MRLRLEGSLLACVVCCAERALRTAFVQVVLTNDMTSSCVVTHLAHDTATSSLDQHLWPKASYPVLYVCVRVCACVSSPTTTTIRGVLLERLRGLLAAKERLVHALQHELTTPIHGMIGEHIALKRGRGACVCVGCVFKSVP